MRNAMSNFICPSMLIILMASMASCKKAEPVVAEFTTDIEEIFTGDVVRFINSSKNANFFQWDFGDGQSSVLESPTHVYDDPGTYKVTLVSIGSEEANTATRDLVVGQYFDETIYAGAGIEGALISDSWLDIRSVFTSDTIYVRNYLEDLETYFHMAYFFNEGAAFVFLNEDTVLNDEDQLAIIYVVTPYAGGTSEGVGIGSTMDWVEVVYGTPEEVVNDIGNEAYWYDSKGIDFITYNSGSVDEIDIYSISTAKSAPVFKSILKDHLRYQDWVPPF